MSIVIRITITTGGVGLADGERRRGEGEDLNVLLDVRGPRCLLKWTGFGKSRLKGEDRQRISSVNILSALGRDNTSGRIRSWMF